MKGLVTLKNFIFYYTFEDADMSPESIAMGQKYKFTFHPKRLGGAGDHGIMFGFDTSKFLMREQITVNFYDLVNGEDHNQNAVCTKLQKRPSEDKK